MSDISTYLKNKINDHILGVATYTPVTLYVALYSVMPTASTSGTELPTGVGYARQPITFSASSSGVSASNLFVSFGPNTTTNWGDVVGAAIVDSGTIGAGNVLGFKAFASSRAAKVGDRIEFNAAAITVSQA